MNGVSAPIYSWGNGEVDLQVPYETSPGTAVLALTYQGEMLWQEFPVMIAAPGIFPVSQVVRGLPAAIYITGDGDVTPTLVTGSSPSRSGDPSRLPKPRLPLTVTLAGTRAPVVFYGVIAAGITQINFNVPPDAPLGPQPIVVTVGAMSSLLVNVNVVSQ